MGIMTIIIEAKESLCHHLQTWGVETNIRPLTIACREEMVPPTPPSTALHNKGKLPMKEASLKGVLRLLLKLFCWPLTMGKRKRAMTDENALAAQTMISCPWLTTCSTCSFHHLLLLGVNAPTMLLSTRRPKSCLCVEAHHLQKAERGERISLPSRSLSYNL